MKHAADFRLMIPGPVQVEDDVLDAMGSPVQPHYGPEFTRLYNDTVSLLKPIFGTADDVFIFSGSGTVGIDACIGSLLSSGEKILIGVNGFFGQRLMAIARGYNLDIIPIEGQWGTPLEISAVEDAIRKNPDARAAAFVHLETSTTIINPIQEIASLMKTANIPVIVDAVSSLGGLPFKMDEWGVDLCASASQKCLGAPPGLGPVAVGKNAWKIIEKNSQKGHGFYSNLLTWRKYATEWADWHPFPITMPTNNVLALNSSLQSLLKEGIENRLGRYRKLALRLRAGLRSIHMQPYTPDELMSPVLTAAYGPEGVPTSRIITYLSESHNIRIAGGLGALKDKIFRIGHMSPVTTEEDIDCVIQALSQFHSK